jgi:nucleotide-binding universal stress UspA family protein
MALFQNILVPLDFGEPSKRALEIAVDLAKQYRATLTLVHAWEIPVYGYGLTFPPDALLPLEGAAREQLTAVLADVVKEVPETKAVL